MVGIVNMCVLLWMDGVVVLVVVVVMEVVLIGLRENVVDDDDDDGSDDDEICLQKGSTAASIFHLIRRNGMLLVIAGDFIHTTQNHIGTVGELRQVFHSSDTREHKNRINLRADTSSNAINLPTLVIIVLFHLIHFHLLSVHTVTNDTSLGTAKTQDTLGITHDQCRWLATVEGLGLGNHFNTSSKGTTRRNLVTLGIKVLNIQVGGNKLGALLDKLNSLGKVFVVAEKRNQCKYMHLKPITIQYLKYLLGRAFTKDNVIGVVVVHEEALIIQGIGKTRLTNGINGTTFGHLGLEEFSSGLTSSEKVILSNINTQTMQLLLKLTRSRSRVVGKEKETLVVAMQKVDELLCTRQEFGALCTIGVSIAYQYINNQFNLRDR